MPISFESAIENMFKKVRKSSHHLRSDRIYYMDISSWLNRFKKSWLTYDVDGVLDLFDKNVEYWETPFYKITNLSELEREWNAIKNQSNLDLKLELFNTQNNKHSVIWDLKYVNQDQESKHYIGTYFITLNSSNKCVYFYQTCQSE